jgi:hypothetical protein
VMIAANGFGQTPGGGESLVLIFYIIVAIVGFVLFYYVVKAAVKNGVIEAKKHADRTGNTNGSEQTSGAEKKTDV